MKVVLLEDNPQIVKDITFCLQVRYPEVTVSSVERPKQAFELIEREQMDLIFLDASMAGEELLNLIRKVRELSEAPLLILSQDETDMDRARGLEAGADEYISRRFSPIELLARCKALLRRTMGHGFNVDRSVSIDGLSINFATREVTLAGNPIKLTPIEFSLLSELVKHEGRVVPTGDLLDRVWGSEYSRDSDMVKTYVYRLRSKLEPEGNSSQRIVNERGFGYRLVRKNVPVMGLILVALQAPWFMF